MKKTLTVVAAVVVILIVIGGAVNWMNTNDSAPSSTPGDSTSQQAAPSTTAEPDWCPAVEVIAAPGTWESKADDDPFNPQANPRSFMLSITRPLQQAYDISDVRVWTLPYTAQFKNMHAKQEMSYDESRQEGQNKVEGELQFVAETCPNTEFILTGFSQGAVLLGDVAQRIGTSDAVIPADRVRGVALVADGRRENGVGQSPSVPVGGIGAEIALEPLNEIVQAVVPGASMRGRREGGFGSLNDRVQQICAPNDSVCDAPQDVGNALGRAQDLVDANGVHSVYATNPDVIPGTTTSQWIVDWARGLIDT